MFSAERKLKAVQLKWIREIEPRPHSFQREEVEYVGDEQKKS